MSLFARRNRGPELKVGQEWHYETRAVEPESTLVIGRIEEGRSGTVVHVSVRGLRITNPNSDSGFATEIAHLPMSDQAIRGSLTTIKGEAPPDSEFENGYQQWLEGTEGEGVWAISVADAISTMEQTLVAAAGRAT